MRSEIRSRPTAAVSRGPRLQRGTYARFDACLFVPGPAAALRCGVAEADRMLSELAKGGHLEVRVEGGKLLYEL